MDKELCGISSNGLIYSIIRDDVVFTIKAGEDFVGGITNPLRTVGEDVSTVGGMNRKHIHDKLDEWINNALKEKTNE
jgi:hypothetical protein